MARERNSVRNITLSDVAAAAGVAPMTVSRYLNQHPNVTDKTARKIAGAIKRLGYTPNIAARILMGQPSDTIGLIVPTLADAFFSEIAHNVQATARERGKLVWVASSDSDSTIETSLLEQMKQHHVDGILLVPTSGKLQQSIVLDRVPIVVLDRPLEQECDAIVVDNRGGAARLIEHFIAHGHKRILCISTDSPTIYTIGERIAGYQDVMRKHRLSAAVRSSLTSRAEVAAEVRLSMNSAKPPQAIFCTNNITTVYLLETLFEDGMRMPQDIAVGGFDDFELASFMRPGVTVVRQPAAELGQQAARVLLDRLVATDSRVNGITTVLPTTLIIRGSCGCTPGNEL